MPIMLITIVIPLHNEAESLPILIEELDQAIAAINHKVEVLMVNDASTDHTAQLLKEIESKFPYVKVITNKKRGRQTKCYQVAFAEARGKYIIRIDGDLQDDPNDLNKFIPYIEADADLIMGLRQLRQHKKMLRLATILFDAFVVLLLDSPLHTNTSSFLAIKSKFIKGIKFKKNDHRYLPLIAMRRGATKISEVIVVHRERKFGKSKYKNFRKILFGIQEVLRFSLRVKLGYYNLPTSNKLCNYEDLT